MSIRTGLFPLSLTLLALSLMPPASAVDSVSLEAGTGKQVQLTRLALQTQWQQRWWQSDGTHLGGYTDINLAQWRGRRFQNKDDGRQTMTDLGITPVLRFQSDSKKGFYAEAGIGAHLLSDLYNNRRRQFSTRFQFGDHLGVGYVTQNGLELSLQFQHFSNAGIRQPNPGEQFIVLKLAYAL